MTTKPSSDWVADCMREYGRVLTGSLSHWCPDFDGMPIDETCLAEIECCSCSLPNIDIVDAMYGNPH